MLCKDMFYDCQLIDVRYQAQTFTWSNGRDRTDLMKEHLDRGLLNLDWSQNIPKTHTTNLPANGSYHLLIILMIER